MLISSLGLERVDILSDLAQYLIPVVGGREDGQPGLTTPLELFSKPDGEYPYVFVQQRSPVMQVRTLTSSILIQYHIPPIPVARVKLTINDSTGSKTRVH